MARRDGGIWTMTMAAIPKSDPETTCALCCRHQRLCDSHVIPEFMYRPGYDEKNRSLELDAETGHRTPVQKGYSEPLLCDDCEGFVNRMYEYPVYRAWYGDALLPDAPPEGPITLLSGFNYPVFKLFHLSILWRAGVASGEAFESVSLGASEKALRGMIHRGEPGDAHDFPIMAVALTMDGGLAHGMVMSPAVREYKGRRIFSMIYGGFEWSVGLGSDWPLEVCRLALQPDGSIRIGVEEWTDNPAVQLFATKHVARFDDLVG